MTKESWSAHTERWIWLVLSFFINLIGASAGGWGTRAVFKGVLSSRREIEIQQQALKLRA